MSGLKQNLNFRDFCRLFSLLPKDPIIWCTKTDAYIFTMISPYFAGAKPPSVGMIFTCWKGEWFVTSPKESCASMLLLFSFFNGYVCACMNIGSWLISRTQKWFLCTPQHCFSPVILFDCTGGLRKGEEVAGRTGAAQAGHLHLQAFELYKRIPCLRLGSNIDMGQPSNRGLQFRFELISTVS